jgi:hypothetical protein
MVNNVDCICSVLEKIDGFDSIWEFERFQKYIATLINSNDLRSIRVQKKYDGGIEEWYRCTGCNTIWRLVFPDFPFKGLWRKV